MNHLDARHVQKLRVGQMHNRALPTGTVNQLIRPRLGQRDQFAQVFCGHRRMHHGDQRAARHQYHRREVIERIELQVVETRIDRVARRHQIEGVAIGRRLDAGLDAQRAARARAILDDHLLTQYLGEFLRQQARDKIGAAARRCRDDNAHGFGGVRLCEHRQRCHQQHCACRGSTQQCAGRVAAEPSTHCSHCDAPLLALFWYGRYRYRSPRRDAVQSKSRAVPAGAYVSVTALHFCP